MNNYKLLMVLLCVTLCAQVGRACKTDMSDCAPTPTAADGILTIDEMFRLADINSKQLRPLLSGIDEAKAGVSVAKSNRLPDLNANLSFSYLGDGFITDRDFTHFEEAPMPHYGNNFVLEASQVVYAGGAINNGIKMAELQHDMAQLQVENKRSAIRFMLVGYYLDLFKCRNMRSVLEKTIGQTRKVIKEMHAREKEGIVLRNDITRYELLLSNLELNLTQIDNTLSILNNNLTTTLGITNDYTIMPDTTILQQTLPLGGYSHWRENAMSNSSALKIAETSVKMSEKNEAIIKADRLPHIALFAGYKMDGPITIEVPPIDKNFNYWYVGVGINYNIASLFKSNKQLTKSRIATQKAREEYDATEEQIALNINADYTRYLEAYEEFKTQQKSVELAIQNYDVTSNRYHNDMALITDMLDASNAKLDAEQKLVNAQINIIYFYYKLLYISGVL
ncbi:MAG: TolC family protein [Bacteroidaceae bacterium]|nr:TolC family protein [Bacteroidaceae bacterium]